MLPGVMEAGRLQLCEAVQDLGMPLHGIMPLLLRLLQVCIQGLPPIPPIFIDERKETGLTHVSDKLA